MHHLMYILTSHFFINFKGTVSNAQNVVYTIISHKYHSATKPNHIILNLSDLKVLPTINDAQLVNNHESL